MRNEKRVVKGYKVLPSVYNKAMRRAKKEDGKLAQLIEKTVTAYSKGVSIEFVDLKNPENKFLGY